VSALRELRRAQIIQVARTIAAERGLEALTIKAIEDRVDFTRGVITYHFDGKDGIVEAILLSALADIDGATGAAVAAGSTPGQQLEAAIRSTVAGFIEQPEAALILINFWARIPNDPAVASLNANLYANYRARSRSLVVAGIEQGLFRDVDPDAVANAVVGAIIGIVTQHFFDPGATDWRAATDFSVEALLRGLAEVP
jgi:AcrR family transcriptional regulator